MFEISDLPFNISNSFDNCALEKASFEDVYDLTLVNNSGLNQTISHSTRPILVKCMSMLNQEDRHFVYDQRGFAMCDLHSCKVLYNRQTHQHNTLSCSGVVQMVDKRGEEVLYRADGLNSSLFNQETHRYFNPLAVGKVDFSDLKQVPSNGLLDSNIDLYYIKDVRSTFYENIYSVNCTNFGRTCVQLTDGKTLCFGNLDTNTPMLQTLPAFVLGAVITHLIGSFLYTIMTPVLGRDMTASPIASIAMYLAPLIGVIFLVMGSTIVASVSFVLGCLISFATVIITVRSVDWVVSRFFI